jgi:hypothetical protein
VAELLQKKKVGKFMDRFPEGLSASFEQYKATQEAFLKSFETENHLDLEKYNFERSKAFEYLKNQLTIMLKRIRGNKNDAHRFSQACQERLASIMEKDKVLANEISKYREQLAQNLKPLLKGKKALAGYGRLSSTTSPKYMSKSG